MPATDAESRHVARTLRALELLAERPRSRSELAAELGVHPRTVRRLINRLVAEGYVAGSGPEGREYEVTLKIVALAGRVLEKTDVVRIAFPYVTRLRNLTGEAAHLSVPGETAVMHLVQETTESVVMVKPRLGEQVPYHSTAVGKALLTFLPERWEHLRAGPLERFTEHTIVDAADLLVELATVRQRGYAVDNLENSVDLRGVAAPVFDHSGAAIGALGISAPSSRLLPEQLPELGQTVADVAGALSAALGFAGPDLQLRQPTVPAGQV